jgi:TonB family protein
MVASIAIHVLLFLWLGTRHIILPSTQTLTEITWLEPAPIAPPAVKAAPIPKERPIVVTPAQTPEHFVRRTDESDFAPRPQAREASEDILHRKLAALERKATTTQASIADIMAPNAYGQPALASVPNDGPPSKSVSLDRRSGTSPRPITLGRSAPKRAMPASALGTVPERTAEPAKLEKTDSSARRIVDGMSLAGPVADRPLVSYRKPEYPEWAKNDGVEASLSLYFIVLPNGKVKENILIEKTSGFEDFDQNAINALLAWRFEALKSGETGEQWGSITFNFRLAD